eukprot:5125812-Amphidinium_carterae.1
MLKLGIKLSHVGGTMHKVNNVLEANPARSTNLPVKQYTHVSKLQAAKISRGSFKAMGNAGGEAFCSRGIVEHYELPILP